MKDEILCPSACCKPGADLLGIVMGSGEVSFLPVPVKIDDSFVQIALQGQAARKTLSLCRPLPYRWLRAVESRPLRGH